MKTKIEDYEHMANSIPGQSFDHEYVDHTRNLDAPFVKWIYRKIDAENELKGLYTELDNAQNQIMQMIEMIESDDQRMVLMKKYIGFKSWSQISDDLYSSIATVRRWHDKAIENLFIKMSRVEQE